MTTSKASPRPQVQLGTNLRNLASFRNYFVLTGSFPASICLFRKLFVVYLIVYSCCLMTFGIGSRCLSKCSTGAHVFRYNIFLLETFLVIF